MAELDEGTVKLYVHDRQLHCSEDRTHPCSRQMVGGQSKVSLLMGNHKCCRAGCDAHDSTRDSWIASGLIQGDDAASKHYHLKSQCSHRVGPLPCSEVYIQFVYNSCYLAIIEIAKPSVVTVISATVIYSDVVYVAGTGLWMKK